MELIREKAAINKHIGRETTQVLLEGDIIVPDIKPDISSILKSEAQIVIPKVNSLTGRISYSGKLAIKILYMAKDGENSVHSISTFAPVDDFLNMEGVLPHAWADFSASIAHMEYRIVNDRKLNYRAVVDVVVDVSENTSADIVRGITNLPSSQQKNTMLVISSLVEKKFDEFTIKDDVVLPKNKPAIRELLSVSFAIANKEVRAFNGRVDISGYLVVLPLYKGSEGDGLIEIAEFELPFSGSIDMAGAKDGGRADVGLSILDNLVGVNPDEDGEDRVLALEAIIGADIKISDNKELVVLEDAYCIDQNLDMKKVPLEYNHLVCRNNNQFNVKEVVALEDAPEILQILTADGLAHLEDIKVVDDKVVVEGFVSANILYVANSDEAPLHSYQASLPIRQVVEAKGARLGMSASVEQTIDHINFNMLSGDEVELRFVLNMDTTVQESISAEYIADINFSPINSEEMDQMPSMVVLYVQKGDSLWGIAKRYNASLEELAHINELDISAELSVGQRLLVVKKVSEEE